VVLATSAECNITVSHFSWSLLKLPPSANFLSCSSYLSNFQFRLYVAVAAIHVPPCRLSDSSLLLSYFFLQPTLHRRHLILDGACVHAWLLYTFIHIIFCGMLLLHGAVGRWINIIILSVTSGYLQQLASATSKLAYNLVSFVVPTINLLRTEDSGIHSYWMGDGIW
jgi:hypothetical protein